ncbi:DUF3800 domain-containing protein [Flavobacterium sp. ZT3R18]|uniref:DUF3800 domain-containing protein n=1 Tax=Flavobacterium sp. ZT3R18 TaxID=2594429 RepID=UPI00117A971C|nr:DUF3800 domain-containing protein [Flavobacterium sp. ZT3R18]TRX38529.1 DUF3800 domain-containing protein [Flavobacterium sp. ZT3R18]
MKYYLFIDESGDHGLKTIDESFPVFLLCGVLISENEFSKINLVVNNTKLKYWNNTNVILHSRDIRKCNNEFKILFDLKIKEQFYNDLNSILTSSNYKIICSAIDKISFIKKYGKLEDDVYEIALSFILERTIFCLDELQDCDTLEIIIEKRGKKEDAKLANHLNKLNQVGTFYVDAERMKKYAVKHCFLDKRKNNNGLQISDLLAYPIARKILFPEGVNISYELIKDKFYTKNGKRYGLKIFP